MNLDLTVMRMTKKRLGSVASGPDHPMRYAAYGTSLIWQTYSTTEHFGLTDTDNETS